MSISPERQEYHRQIDVFAKTLPKGGLVLDIGKSPAYDYTDYFPDQVYKTVDRQRSVNPDYYCDLENPTSVQAIEGQADGLLINGVLEQCDNPFTIITAVARLVKPGGKFLWGVIGPGYHPVLSWDHVRFTTQGITRALERSGYAIAPANVTVVHRKFKEEHRNPNTWAEVPSYTFIRCELK